MFNETKISIIIPCLNEEQNIASLLDKIKKQKNVDMEIIVVDGGSSDCTREIAKKMEAKVIPSEKGRAKQMNAGRKEAEHELLLFLHADSEFFCSRLLGEGCKALVKEAQEKNTRKIAGHFSLHFICKKSKKSFGYFYYEEKSKLNRTDVFGGDQGLLIFKDFFDEIGGFDEKLDFLEDKKLAREILDKGTMITLPGSIGTSARRFETQGFYERTIVNILSLAFLYASYHSYLKITQNFYPEQNKSQKMNLHAFFVLLEKNKPSLMQRAFFYFPLGRYTRCEFIWQIFFNLDVRLRYLGKTNRGPFLFFYDKFLFPLTNYVLFDIITTIFMVLAYHGLRFYYWCSTRQMPK